MASKTLRLEDRKHSALEAGRIFNFQGSSLVANNWGHQSPSHRRDRQKPQRHSTGHGNPPIEQFVPVRETVSSLDSPNQENQERELRAERPPGWKLYCVPYLVKK